MNSSSTITLSSGRAMPVMGLGTWKLTNDTAGTVEEALELGYRMIDTSRDYGTQPGIAEAIRRSGIDRDEIFLVTKVEEDEDAYDATRNNLDQVDREYTDLMLIHRPPDGRPGRDLWEGLVRAKEDGLARDIGVSNYTPEQIDALVEATGEPPVVNQIEWTPFGWSEETRAYCRAHDIVIQAYSPLTRTRRLGDDRLEAIAETCGRTPAQVVLRWNLQHRTVPLPKASRTEHLVENLEVFDFELDETVMKELDALNEHYSALGGLPYV